MDFEKPIDRVPIPIEGVSDTKHRGVSSDDLVDVPEKAKKNFFKHTPLGRTLSLRNKTGKTLAGLAVTVIGTTTGLELDLISNPTSNIEAMELIKELLFNFAQSEDWVIIATSIVLLLTTVTGSMLVYKGVITKRMQKEFEDVIKAVRQARDAQSDGGAKFTRAEKKRIQHETLELVEVVLKDKLGLDFDLNLDGK